MKKILCILIILTCIFFVSCKNKDIEASNKFILENNSSKKLVDISSDVVLEKVNKKDSFILYLYIVDCGHCMSFSKIANKLIDDTNIMIYKTELIDEMKEYFNYTYAPTVLIIKEGNVIATDDDYKGAINSYDSFKKFLNDFIYFNVLSITLNEYNSFIEDKKSFNLYIGREDCSTCNYFKAYVLDRVNFDLLYYFDTSFYRNNTNNDLMNYDELRDYLDFNWTPTIRKIKDGKYERKMVFLDTEFYNEELVVKDNEHELNGTYKNYNQKKKCFLDYYVKKFKEFMEE